MTSVAEFEAKLNSAIERNALLESEQDEARAMVQRLKDEARGECISCMYVGGRIIQEMKFSEVSNKTVVHIDKGNFSGLWFVKVKYHRCLS